MKRFVVSTALALSLAGPALANDQLARSIGVEPGVYTTPQLVSLRDALTQGDRSRVAAIERSVTAGDYTASTMSGASTGKTQIAAALGVEANDNSLAQLVALRNAVSDGDQTRVSAIKREIAAGGYAAPSNAGAGAHQLAAALGVEAGDYSLAQLVELRDAVAQGDHAREAEIRRMGESG